ncbi:MAG: endonuclease/exonuclease/phosphatase family protein, partial [Myxococcota bacterium]
ARWPITERDVLPLPDTGDGETRSALSVTVSAPQPVGPFSVTCTHLHWKFHHSAVRERQVVVACDRVLARRRRGGFPPLLLGDFNAEPESAEIRYVTGLQSLRGRSVALLDAWRAAGKGGSGITWSNANDYARMGLEPDRRIDYVFAGFPRRDGIGQITHCRVVCNEPKGGVWPSDHFGVYAELRAVPLPEPPPFDDAA